MKKKIAILGGGYAGVLTAKNLAKKFKRGSGVDILLIDKNPFHTMLTELHEVAACRVEENSIKVSLEKIFAQRNVDVVLDTIDSIDYENRTLIGKSASYDYDYLVLSSGSKPTFFGIEGAEANTHKLWSYEDAVKLRNHMVAIFAAAALEPDEQKRRKLLTFFVVGAGFTGVEMVGELAEWLPHITVEYELDPKEVSIVNVDMLDRVVPTLPEKLSAKVHKRLEKMGVQVMLKRGVVGIGPDYIDVKAGDEIKRYDATTIIWSAGVEGADIAFASGKALGQAVGRGRVQTDEFLRAAGREDVFIGGDNIFYIPEGSKMPVPQMVENCETSSHTISVNIAAAIPGHKMESYKPKFHGVMVCVGGRYGVAHVGTDKMKFALPSFLAMFTKHFINIVYFIQLLGWNRVYSYICHEFAKVKNNRSFIGGHFSNRTPNFWMVPLRVFLGGIWLYEGIKKVQEGWLTDPKLEAFFGGANKYFDSILGQTAGWKGEGSDAVTAASGAAGAKVGDVLINWDIFGLIKVILVSATDVAFKIQVSFVDWMANTVVLASPESQMFFQIMIVALEIIIGLSLIGGLFTFLSAGMSLVLQMMFVTTTGLYMASWWMFFAGIAMLFGSGSVLGLDYYVLPWLKKKWKNVKFVQKWYIYND
jgi:NADH dehydrogenase